jgi:hypothetical protein
MKRTLLTLSSMMLLMAGCGGNVRTLSRAPAVGTVAVALPKTDEAAPMRIPGDFAVYRISGNFRESPVSIIQRVIERRNGVMLLELSIEDRGTTERLRLRVDDGARRGELLSVAKIEGGVLVPFGIAAYEQRMSELVPAADDNEGAIGEGGEIVKVGSTSIQCKRTEYRVRIGAHRGIMTTLSAAGFPWDNLGGRIVADDGTTIYQAQLVELGNQQPNTLPSGRGLTANASDLYDEIEE